MLILLAWICSNITFTMNEDEKVLCKDLYDNYKQSRLVKEAYVETSTRHTFANKFKSASVFLLKGIREIQTKRVNNG